MPPHHVHPSTCGALHRLLLRHGDAFVWLGHLLYLVHQGTLTTGKALLRALAALRPNGVAFVLYMTEPQSSTDDQCMLLTCPPHIVPMLSEVMYSTASVRICWAQSAHRPSLQTKLSLQTRGGLSPFCTQCLSLQIKRGDSSIMQTGRTASSPYLQTVSICKVGVTVCRRPRL